MHTFVGASERLQAQHQNFKGSGDETNFPSCLPHGQGWKWAISHFCSFTLFERAKERSLFRKERKKERSHIRSFQKSDTKSDCSFALLQRVTKTVIAHSIFFKERKWAMTDWANVRMSDERLSECANERWAMSNWANVRMSDERLSKCANEQLPNQLVP